MEARRRFFGDPSEWTLAVVGAIDEEEFLRCVRSYVATIPVPKWSQGPISREQIKPLNVHFPLHRRERTLRKNIVERDAARLQLTFPVRLSATSSGEAAKEGVLLELCLKLLESHLLKLLRFRLGDSYNVGVSKSFSLTPPLKQEQMSFMGNVTVDFTSDPKSLLEHKLRDLCLEELSRLQEEGPSEQDASSAVEVERRAHEVARQENSFWAERILGCYQPRIFSGDPDYVHQLFDVKFAPYLLCTFLGCLKELERA